MQMKWPIQADRKSGRGDKVWDKIREGLHRNFKPITGCVSTMKERLYKALHEKKRHTAFPGQEVFFNLFQWFGFHLTGDHFYEVIPNTRLVAAKYTDEPRPLRGIDFRLTECEARALRLIKTYGADYANDCAKYGFQEKNVYFRGLDALMLYVILRDLRPTKIVENWAGIFDSHHLERIGAQRT